MQGINFAGDGAQSSVITRVAGALRANRAMTVVVALVLVGLVGSWWWVTSTVPISSFELEANGGDAVGITAETTFTLKSNNDLSADTVKEALTTEPAVDFDVEKTGRGTYTITPTAGLPENRVLSIAVEGEVADQPYSWAFMVKAPMGISTATPRHQATGVPRNTGIELTFNRSGIEDPEESISIEPSVSVRFESDDTTVTLVPLTELKPATVYTVTVRAGLGAADTDDTLAEDAVIRFETESDAPDYGYGYFSVDRLFWDFPSDQEPVFGVQADETITAVRMRVYRFADAAELIGWYSRIMQPELGWSQYNRTSRDALPDGNRVWDGSVPLERGELSSVIRVPQRLGDGFYAARIDRDGAARPSMVWFQMTPIASYLALSGDKTMVALRSTVTDEPVSGAEVSLGSQRLGTSGSDGVALFETPEQLVTQPGEADRFFWGAASNFLTVRAGDRTLIVPVESQYGWYWRITPPERFWSYLSEDKTIYQPTDTLRFWGVVKQRNGEEMRGKTVTVQLEDGYWFEGPMPSDAKVYARTTATISDFYTLTGALNLAGLEPRTYQLVVRMGTEVVISDTITVQAYVKPAYRIEIAPSAVTMFAGDPLTFDVTASFFDGTPVDRLALTYEGWGNGGTNFNGSLRLDAEGRGSFSVRVPYQDQRSWPGYLTMRVTPERPEEGDLSATTWVNVFGPSLYLSVNQTSQEEGRRESFDLKLRRVDLAAAAQGQWYDPERDQEVSRHPVDVSVTEITYIQEQIGTGYDPINKVTYPIYRYRDERRVVANQTVATDGDGDATFAYPLSDDKGYEFQFTTRDEAGRVESQLRYAYRTPWAYSTGYGRGVSIRMPGSSVDAYGIGDRIEAEVYDMSGADLTGGNKRFLFLRLVNGLQSYVAQDGPRFSDEFRKDYVPNVQVMGVYYDGDRFVDTTPLNYLFDADERRLDISVKTDKERYRPGETAKLDFTVTDRNGRPVTAEVNVSALDEAVFSLNPDLRDFVSFLYRGIYSPILTRSSHKAPLNAAGAEMGGCFLPGTAILTADGERPIEDIRVGDRILTLASDGTLVEQPVVRTSSHLVEGYLVINETLRVSINHRIRVNDAWTEAGAIRVGDRLTGSDGADIPVTAVRRVGDLVRVHNFEVQPAHTYIAEGVWVHNEEKGGGAVRADFKDQALYTSVRTGGDGRGSVTFTLPDNITSWRVTAQAVTRDLDAGSRVAMVPVGLPFFVDATLNRTYLTGDQPVLRLRTFGTEVPDQASFSIDAPTLPVGRRDQSGGRRADIALGTLTAGTHQVTVGANAGSRSDAVRRTVTVLDSYFARRAVGFYELREDLERIEGTADGYTDLTFQSLERGKVYGTLTELSWGHGSRLDATLANRGSALLLRDSFGEADVTVPEMNAGAWQLAEGGMALLPYGGDDLELSAKTADAGPSLGVGLATDQLRNYFQTALTDGKQDIHRRAIALYGLAALREPYLRQVRDMARRDDLEVRDALYVALALDRLGAKNEARDLWARTVEPVIERRDDTAWLAGGTSEEVSVRTALAAWLAAGLRVTSADALMNYVLRNPPTRTLVDLERYGWARDSLRYLRQGPVSFSYTVDGETHRVSLDKDERFTLALSASQVSSLRFSGIEGRVGLVTAFMQRADADVVQRDPSVGLSRQYLVGGAATTTFREGDVIEVRLTPDYARAPVGGYEITDYLPSGLRAIEGPPPGGYRWDSCVAWPLQVQDQRVSLFSYHAAYPTYQRCRTVSYYARIVSAGTYRAEPALIQMFGEPQRQNLSAPATVIIQ